MDGLKLYLRFQPVFRFCSFDGCRSPTAIDAVAAHEESAGREIGRLNGKIKCLLVPDIIVVLDLIEKGVVRSSNSLSCLPNKVFQ